MIGVSTWHFAYISNHIIFSSPEIALKVFNLEREIERSRCFINKKMKNCELCKSTARIYCDSDRASLCWTCDAQVHSANFLVAKHSRSLLCKICQSPTKWSAFGEKLSPSTASICGICDVEGVSNDHDKIKERVGGNDCETDNQVMPWNSTPPPAASSSGTEEYFSCKGAVKLKRKRQNVTDLTLKV